METTGYILASCQSIQFLVNQCL